MRTGAVWLAFTLAKPCKHILFSDLGQLNFRQSGGHRYVKKNWKNQKIFFQFFEKSSKFGKVPRRPSHIFLQQGPIKTGAWIFFAAGCNVFVSGNVLDGVGLRQGKTELA